MAYQYLWAATGGRLRHRRPLRQQRRGQATRVRAAQQRRIGLAVRAVFADAIEYFAARHELEHEK